jgi:hypothetical protein
VCAGLVPFTPLCATFTELSVENYVVLISALYGSLSGYQVCEFIWAWLGGRNLTVVNYLLALKSTMLPRDSELTSDHEV